MFVLLVCWRFQVYFMHLLLRVQHCGGSAQACGNVNFQIEQAVTCGYKSLAGSNKQQAWSVKASGASLLAASKQAPPAVPDATSPCMPCAAMGGACLLQTARHPPHTCNQIARPDATRAYSINPHSGAVHSFSPQPSHRILEQQYHTAWIAYYTESNPFHDLKHTPAAKPLT